MQKDATTNIELILNPSLSSSTLATQVVERGDFVVSVEESSDLIAPNGETVMVETGQIKITPRMKVVLLPQDPEAFIVAEMHDNAEQVVSSVETTIWRWSITAKKEGQQTLQLVIYQLVKDDEKEFWREVETYKANIIIEVTMAQWIKSLDWKWIASFVLAFVGSVLGVFNWLNNRNKESKEDKSKAHKLVKSTKKRNKP